MRRVTAAMQKHEACTSRFNNKNNQQMKQLRTGYGAQEAGGVPS
jgi:hypothetical protein